LPLFTDIDDEKGRTLVAYLSEAAWWRWPCNVHPAMIVASSGEWSWNMQI